MNHDPLRAGSRAGLDARNAFVVLVLVALAGPLAAQGRPIGFEETYALAPDRAKAVATLIPGTEDQYYWSCRERLDARDLAAVRKILPAWIHRHGRSARVIEIENREALLAFADDPARTWNLVRERLGLHFDHQKVVPGAKSDLPTRLDPALVSNEAMTKHAFEQHSGTVDGFTDHALAGLAGTALDADHLHSLLARLARPDVDNLPALVVRDLEHPQSGGFGRMPVHAMLRRAQLDECARLRPALLKDIAFVRAYLVRLQPGCDTAWQHDPAERAAQLARLWEFAQRLPPAFNSLRAHVLYHWLSHDLGAGAPDKDRFLAYIRLPRRGAHASDSLLKRYDRPAEFVHPEAEYPTGLLPIRDDEALLRACLERFFATEDGYEAYADFLQADWLKVVLAETKILLGQGDLDHWSSMLGDPASLKRLEQRVDIEFARTSRERYGADEPVRLEAWVKHVPTLIVKVFAIDAFRYLIEKQAPVGVAIDLDGIVPNFEQTFTYPEPALRRMLRTFDLPMLREPGTYVVELVGNGMSSRAVIHKGDLRAVDRITASGHVFRVYDETGMQKKSATIWFGGREYPPEADGDIILPFSTSPGPRNVVLHDQNRAALAPFTHSAESYALRASVHVDREALVAGAKAKLVMRPELEIAGHPVSLALLSQPVLTVTATDLDGIETAQTVRDLKLADDRDLVHEFTVPERLASLRVGLTGRVKDLAGKDVDLSGGPAVFAVNGVDATPSTSSILLARTPEGYSLEVRGKDGEPRPGETCLVHLKHRDYTEPVSVSLQTDGAGRIALGALAGFETVGVRRSDGYEGSFEVLHAGSHLPSTLHGLAGETLRVLYHGAANAPSRAELSLLGNERDEFEKLAIQDGFVEMRGLEPGDYELRLHDLGAAIQVRVTRGARNGPWLIGRDRVLESDAAPPLAVRSAGVEGPDVVVRVSNATKSTRVHLVATRFVPPFAPLSDLFGAPLLPDPVTDTDRIESTYHSGRKLGDEYRYVLERRFATKYPGNMLRRPSLLLNPWAIQEQSRNEQQGAGEGGGYGGARRAAGAGRRSGQSAAPSAPPPAPAGAHANLDFLPAASSLLANLVPDEKGVVRVKAADLGEGQIVHVVAIDGGQTVYDAFLRDEVVLKPRLRHLPAALDGSQHFVEQKRIEFVAGGGTATLEDARSARVEIYDSLAGVYRLFQTIVPDPAMAEFAFVLEWPKLPADRKRELFSKHACHELSFFLHKKDPEFFASTVKPFLANKLDKTFLDHWLLGDDLGGYLEPWSFAQLNLIEKILLAQRLDPPRALAVARVVREGNELRPVQVEKIERLWRTLIGGKALEAEVNAVRLGLEATAFESRAAAPAATAPAKGEVAADEKRFGDVDRLRDADGAGKPGNQPQHKNSDKEAKKDVRAREGFREEDLERARSLDSVAQTPALKLAEELEKRKSAAVLLYRAVDPTRVLAERNYWNRRIEQTTPDVVPPNRFWVDYATAKAGAPFASSAVLECGGSFLEAMFALAVLDLPFEPGKHEVTPDGDRRTLRAATPLLLVRKEVAKSEKAADQPPMLIGENFFRLDEPYRFENGEKQDAFVTDEFVVDVAYGCQVVVTNPTSNKRTAELLMQIPAGALPVRSGFWTKGMPVELQPYATATVDYAFYFPAPGDFAHYPVHAAEKGRLAASAAPRTLHVVLVPTRVDTSSWEHVSQQGSPAEVLAHVDAANIQRLDLAKVAWRMKDREFFTALLAKLRARHAYDDTLWSYGILHRDPDAAREYLRHADAFLQACGDELRSTLVSIDAKERKGYQQLDLDPLVHARAHRLGGERVIGNADLAQQYSRFMRVIGYHEKLEAADWLAVTYYLLLQDRVEEALASFARVQPEQTPARIQYDYLKAYLGFFTGDAPGSRAIAERYREYPVDHWRKRFADVIAQLDEAEGNAKPVSGDVVTADPAAAAPSLELAIDGTRARIAYKNVTQCEVRYYELDVEFAFSAQPFANEGGTSAAYVRPNLSETKDLPQGQAEAAFDVPAAFQAKNVLVEVRGKGLVRSRTYFSNALDVRMLESFGQVAVTEPGTNKPLPKTYVKVFAKLANGQVRFHKDGYTDLRGRFDYASVSDDPDAGASRYSVLVLSDARGAVIREATPPVR